MKRIGVLTSGGDAPGMNAAIRAVTRTALHKGMEVIGIRQGYRGLLDRDTVNLDIKAVGGILQLGGTLLKTARCPEFATPQGVAKAVANCKDLELDALVAIGGDGTFRGALDLSKSGVTVMGVPGTIDNDMGYTDYTIGFDTAVNFVIDSITRLKETALAHNKATIIEVMGRHCGDIALMSGLCGGAEHILIPEIELDVAKVCGDIKHGMDRGKSHCIVIKAEGVEISSHDLAKSIENVTGEEPRLVVLGYLQRGGAPTARDRMLAALTGNMAVELIEREAPSSAVGITGSEITALPL